VNSSKLTSVQKRSLNLPPTSRRCSIGVPLGSPTGMLGLSIVSFSAKIGANLGVPETNSS